MKRTIHGLMTLASLVSAGCLSTPRVHLILDAAEARAVLAILDKRQAGTTIEQADWDRLFATEPYVRLGQREAQMNRAFTDAEFRSFVLSEPLLARRADLARTLDEWQRADLAGWARRMLQYLPAEARIEARVYFMIKPRPNSFVYDAGGDPAGCGGALRPYRPRSDRST